MLLSMLLSWMSEASSPTRRRLAALVEAAARRGLATIVVLGLLCASAPAQTSTAATQPGLDPGLGIVTLPLWNGAAPGAHGSAPEDVPTLTLLQPQDPNGTAVIVAPGGGYMYLAAKHEGREPADQLAALGTTVFVLKYRLGAGYLYPVPLEDARRAVRLVRSLAPKYGYSPDRIGMMGFSAGGHLTAMTGTSPAAGRAGDPDPVERQSSELNFMILVYPWLNAMEPQVSGPRGPLINYCSVLKGLTQADCARLRPEYTPALHITSSTPPTIIFHTSEDDTVPVSTSVEFYSAMHAAGRDCELHLFAHGPHGFGTGGNNPVLSQWSGLLEHWMRARGWLTPAGAARP